jgi:UDP-2-acetamido-3-amino-2,3-dideoxy-glucuronate N-acetyltransferase
MSQQQVAVIGCGYWGKNLVRNFAQLQSLRWICDANEALLQAQKALHPQVQIETEFENILNNPEVRAIVLATPAALHYAQAKEAILRGKHVFVEKPLALRYYQGQELVELARDRGVILMVGHILEYHPAVTLLKRLVQQGELGEIRYIYSNRLNLGKVRKEENILWSFAPHDISVITSLVGMAPDLVTSSGGNYLQSDIADVTVTNLLFRNGVRAHIFVSWLHPYKEQKLVVVGDRKMAVFDDMAQEGKLKIYDKGIEWQNGMPVPRQTAETTLFIDQTEPLRLECQHFLTCIREQKQPLTNGKNALRVLKVLEASQMSLDQGGFPIYLSQLETADLAV